MMDEQDLRERLATAAVGQPVTTGAGASVQESDIDRQLRELEQHVVRVQQRHHETRHALADAEAKDVVAEQRERRMRGDAQP